MRRFDLDGDAKVSFQEFIEALTPVQPDVILNPIRNFPEKRIRTVSSHSNNNRTNDELMTSTIKEEVNEKDNKRNNTLKSS